MKFFGYLLIVPVVLATIAFGALWSGFVLATLWAWFIVPTFGLTALTSIQSIGIVIIARFMTYQIDVKELISEEDNDTQVKKGIALLAFTFLYPLLVLTLGWVVHKFMLV